MCLIIDSEKHNNSFSLLKFRKCYKPIKLDKDLIVYKIILYDVNNNKYTPFTHHKLVFNKENKIYKVHEVFSKTKFIAYSRNKGKNGYHSYISLIDAIKLNKILNKNKNRFFVNHKIHICIIPKESLVYYGIDGDIVSNNIKITDTALFNKLDDYLYVN